MSNSIDFIDVRCRCGHAFRVKAVAEGRSVRCPKCKFPNSVRRPDQVAASPSALSDLATAAADLADDSFENEILSALGAGSGARVSSPEFDPEIPADIVEGQRVQSNSVPSSRPTPPPQPKAASHPPASKPRRFDLISFLAQAGTVVAFLGALLLLLFMIASSLEALAGSDYIFKDDNAIGYTANQLRAIREDLAFFKILVLFLLVGKAFTMMVRALDTKRPAEHTE